MTQSAFCPGKGKDIDREPDGDPMNGVTLACARLFNVQLRAWETLMSDTVAHLINAYLAIGEMTKCSLSRNGASTSFDLALRGICTALVTLDECSLAVWTPVETPHRTKMNSRVRLPAWRECLFEESEARSIGKASDPAQS